MQPIKKVSMLGMSASVLRVKKSGMARTYICPYPNIGIQQVIERPWILVIELGVALALEMIRLTFGDRKRELRRILQ